jgi:hypothetical protein
LVIVQFTQQCGIVEAALLLFEQFGYGWLWAVGSSRLGLFLKSLSRDLPSG